MKRRKKGDGSFTKLTNGKISYRVNYGIDPLSGKRIRKTFTGKTEGECRKRAREYEQSLSDKQAVLSIHTLGGWLQEWLETYKKNSVTDATYENYEHNANKIFNHSISEMELIDIKPIHITKFYNDHKKYSRSVLGKLRYLLHGSFESAIDN